MENYELKANGIIHKVNYVPGGYSSGNMGKWNQEESKIYINENMPDPVKFQTIVHELFHIFFENAALRQGDDEERIVSGLSVQLYDFLLKNREFVVDLINTGYEIK